VRCLSCQLCLLDCRVLILRTTSYPHALHHLELLQHAKFRAEIKKDDWRNYLNQQQFDHWRTWSVIGLSLLYVVWRLLTADGLAGGTRRTCMAQSIIPVITPLMNQWQKESNHKNKIRRWGRLDRIHNHSSLHPDSDTRYNKMQPLSSGLGAITGWIDYSPS